LSNKKGFTLIEMLIVLAIIGIMFSATYPSLVSTMKTSKENDRARHEYVVNKALKQCYALTGKYPNQEHDTSKKEIPSVVESVGPLGETIYTLYDELLALNKGLKEQTGVTLDMKNYTYTYKSINGDGKAPYDISSLHVERK